ncbi:Peroxidase [Bradyrhizobium sp. ORS 278]|uniref:Dyp-type peroxidase n=1 Tax=Bradyrhizobium sp. (strain ORS 278) TaxID=114615 RepID=UPI0001507C8E|nr:peroxidase [Bradyrhizobium sp. ORS 278]CAL75159.1 Peroxidase [Bradyrhizobium sp. ORS 278]
MAAAQEPLLDAADIQGNILPGFSRQQQYFVAFSCDRKDALQAVLAELPRPTPLSTVLGHRDDRKAAFMSGEPRPQRDDLWLNLALGPNATDALGAPQVRQLDSAFNAGMRTGITGDPTAPVLPDGKPNPSSRDHWLVGAPSKPVDLLLIFAHDGNIVDEAAPIVDRVSEIIGAAPNYVEPAAMLPGSVEHFGFRDGISQPGVRGRIVQDGAERFITTRYGVPSQNDIDFGKPGQPLVWPGQFLAGQPRFEGDTSVLAPELTNGSFLVFRRLRQDVAAFESDTQAMALALGDAGGRPIPAEHLRALIVGRHRSGNAIMRGGAATAQADDPNAINYFSFANALPAISLDDGTQVSGSLADPDPAIGRLCPAWAHIRKVNPRDLQTDRGGALTTLGFQMLRRGIPFGPPFDRDNPQAPVNAEDRGLLFVSYQRAIDDQFGSLNRGWMNNPNAPTAGGFDLLVGQNVDPATRLHTPKPASFFGLDTGGTALPFAAPNQWVIPTGGAFLFAPSVAFIDEFAAPRIA